MLQAPLKKREKEERVKKRLAQKILDGRNKWYLVKEEHVEISNQLRPICPSSAPLTSPIVAHGAEGVFNRSRLPTLGSEACSGNSALCAGM